MTLTATSFDWVRQLVHRESAIVLQPGKEYLVEARLLPIARKMGLDDVAKLVDQVRSRPTPEGTRSIVEALTTNETSWFRDGDPFTALTATVLPALLAARGPHERLQIWSAACSSGQEPYTIAMLMADHAAPQGAPVQIVASDISQEMLDRIAEAIGRLLPAARPLAGFPRATAGIGGVR